MLGFDLMVYDTVSQLRSDAVFEQFWTLPEPDLTQVGLGLRVRVRVAFGLVRLVALPDTQNRKTTGQNSKHLVAVDTFPSHSHS